MDSLVVSASKETGGYAISRQNNLELHLGCHTCCLIYFTLVCLWVVWTGGRSVDQSDVRSRDYQNSWMGRLPHLLGMGLRLRARRAPLLECA